MLLFSIAGYIIISCRKDPGVDNLTPTNTPPVASAGNDTIIVLPIDSVLLNGEASHDEDGSISTYRWSKIYGPSSITIDHSQSAQATIKNLSEGTFQFELAVTDNSGLLGKDTLMITVDKVATINHAPIARVGTDLVITLPVNFVELDGSQSLDSDNDLTSYAWRKISGPPLFYLHDSKAKQTRVSTLVKGIYQFELEVADASGLTGRDTMQVTVYGSPPTVICEPGRPGINARLVPVGNLSVGRIGFVSAAAGSKIAFAGGMKTNSYSSSVDIYDTITKKWSTAELTQPERQGMVAASVGDKILFAGGGDNDNGATTSRVDIYNVSTNSWSVAELSRGRQYLAAATLGDKVFFAGGTAWETSASGYSTWVTSNVVDIYDNSNDAWSTASLTGSRSHLTATTAGNKVYFAGGYAGPFFNNVSAEIDIYDEASDSWSTSHLEQAKAQHSSIATGNKIFWAVGIFNYINSTLYPSNSVEIRDIITGVSTHVCILPKIMSSAASKDDNIIFFPGNFENGYYSGSQFDIYNTTTGQWSFGNLDLEIYDAAVITFNNTIYVAGGRNKAAGPYFTEVWKLEF